ncbi:MAG: hypothetical protein Q7S87_03175 [Agitococcus sp.]|nr:hypothetical protein [Agitococcus sp.]
MREPKQENSILLSEFNAWLLKEESDKGSMGLSQLERDQMCMSYCAGHHDKLTLQPSATLLRALDISRFSFSTRTGVYLDEEGDYAPFTQVEVLRTEALKQRKSYERAMHACDKQSLALTQQATRIQELEQQLYNLQRILLPSGNVATSPAGTIASLLPQRT